jgi:putative ABC transport system permease protein
MRLSDYIQLSFSSLWKRRLRTFLTVFGVTIGIGALVSMVSFGKGVQKNVADSFRSLELFNSITVFASDFLADGRAEDPDRGEKRDALEEKSQAVLDDAMVTRIGRLKGVEFVFPEVRIPAAVRFNDEEEFRLLQVIPAEVASSKMMRYRAGKAYSRDDGASVIVSSSLLRQFKVKDLESVLGQKIVISSLALDFSLLNPAGLAAVLQGGKLPFTAEKYELTIVGVIDDLGFGGPSPIRSDVFVPPETSRRMKRLPFSSIWDLFRAQEGRLGYSALNVRLSSPWFVESVKKEISEMGFRTLALLDQFREVQQGFLVMNMILAAVGMIAIVVASLGIINTMIMSILERYSEIGIMKAVGASDGDIQRVFFFESSAIGFLGGIFGLALGYGVSGLINRIVNYFLARQGVPFIDYFSFPLWLGLGAVAFSIVVSLVSGIYPARRAARIDPVRALRHD